MEKVEIPSGHYPIQNRLGEVERLRIQDAVLSEATNNLFDVIGVSLGWRCLDLGCGPGGVTNYLLDRVGSGGHVTGLDGNEEFLALARIDKAENSEFILGDAYSTGLSDNLFDLVHVRFLASTAGEPEGLVSEAVRLVAPGGVIAMQEADFHTLRCFPEHPAWTELTKIFIACFPDGDDDPISHRLYRLMRHAGLEDVGYKPVLVGTREQDAWQDYLPSTVESMEKQIIGGLGVPKGDLERLIADVREHLANPETVWTSYTVVQTWGRMPRI